MGIDFSGGMIVGECGDKLSVPEGNDMPFYEWAEDVGLERLSMYYDADTDQCYYGFLVDDIEVDAILSSGWLQDVAVQAARFKEITGVKARLIGSQDIT